MFLSQKGWSTSQVSGFKIKTQTGYMFITSMFFTSMFLLLNSPFKASKVCGLYSSNCIGVAMSLFFRLPNFNRTYYSILIRFSLVFQRSITSLATNLVLATNSRLHQLFCWSTFLLIVNISKRKLLQQQNNQESITSLATNLVLATNFRLHQLFCWSTFLLIVNISKRKLLQQQNNQEIKIT